MLLGSADHKAWGEGRVWLEGKDGFKYLSARGTELLGILFPQFPREGSGAEMLNLGACRDESPRIFLPTSPYGIGHLVKQ